VSPASSVSSNDSVPAVLPRATLLGQRYRGGGGHKPTTSSVSTHIFPNEYSIPTIPLPPSSPSIHGGLKLPESPPRFRRRDVPVTGNESADSTPTKSPGGTTRDSSVRFALPDDIDGSLQFPMTSTPNPTSRTQQLLDQEANAYDSVKSFMSAYNTPSSPPRTAASRFRRTQQTPAAQKDSPSKLLRTLSRATTATPSTIPPLDQSSYKTPASVFQTPGFSIEEEEEGEISLDEADKTLDSILESTEDASSRIRRVLDESRLQRAIRQGNSPASTQEVSVRSGVESPPAREVEMSVWGEKSFFRRMAKKAPGGWAFTPQPKLGRIIDVHEEERTEEPVQVYSV